MVMEVPVSILLEIPSGPVATFDRSLASTWLVWAHGWCGCGQWPGLGQKTQIACSAG